MSFVRKVAASEATTILIQGESGTGKDLIAKAIHYESTRQERPFVAINCSAIPETLMEAELFGHEKGAFTDAKAMKKGLFEIADGGTLFLDEIGELSPLLQAKLLRVLEDQVIRRIGGVRDMQVNVRVIAASNRDSGRTCITGWRSSRFLFRRCESTRKTFCHWWNFLSSATTSAFASRCGGLRMKRDACFCRATGRGTFASCVIRSSGR
jgi:transcriptional regulator with AAA-type ATPase domain